MTTLTVEATSAVLDPHRSLPPAELAAAAFLARYRGRTLESYRHDLRCFFAWAQEVGLEVAARHADPRTTTIYDHRRQSLDRHAAYVVVAFVTGG